MIYRYIKKDMLYHKKLWQKFFLLLYFSFLVLNILGGAYYCGYHWFEKDYRDDEAMRILKVSYDNGSPIKNETFFEQTDEYVTFPLTTQFVEIENVSNNKKNVGFVIGVPYALLKEYISDDISKEQWDNGQIVLKPSLLTTDETKIVMTITDKEQQATTLIQNAELQQTTFPIEAILGISEDTYIVSEQLIFEKYFNTDSASGEHENSWGGIVYVYDYDELEHLATQFQQKGFLVRYLQGDFINFQHYFNILKRLIYFVGGVVIVVILMNIFSVFQLFLKTKEGDIKLFQYIGMEKSVMWKIFVLEMLIFHLFVHGGLLVTNVMFSFILQFLLEMRFTLQMIFANIGLQMMINISIASIWLIIIFAPLIIKDMQKGSR